MRQHHGFSLIELAIVLVIITVLIGGLAVPLTAQIQSRRIAETQKTLEEAREAIIGYAMSNVIEPCECIYHVDGDGISDSTTCPMTISCPVISTPPTSLMLTLQLTRHYLPCPDTDNDGLEDRGLPGNANACKAPAGLFPWVTLATARQDAWGNHIRYAVAKELADKSTGFYSSIDTTTVSWNQILSSTSKCNPLNVDVASDAAVVLLSHGPNSRGARNVNLEPGTATPAPSTETGAEELQNLGSPQNGCTASFFISSNPSKDYDDVVSWISFPQLISRICPAGGCP